MRKEPFILPKFLQIVENQQDEQSKENTMNIFVGNLSRQTAEGDLRQAFEVHGQVATAKVITDRSSGESKGFGFVEMPTQAEGEAAIANLNGKELQGRSITVNISRPKSENSGGGNRN
jgi:RNA recognition motif-containing protein